MTLVTRKLLDETFPPRGPCAFCGHSQARHRVTDAIRRTYRAGESVHVTACWYEYPEPAVRALTSLSPQAYGAWLRSGVANAR